MRQDPILRLHAPGTIGKRNLISVIASHDQRSLAGAWLEQNIPEMSTGPSCRLEIFHHPENASRFSLAGGTLELIVFSDGSLAIATGGRDGMEILPLAFTLAREQKLGDGLRVKLDVRRDLLGKIQIRAILLQDGKKADEGALFAPRNSMPSAISSVCEKIEAEVAGLASHASDLPSVALRPFEALCANEPVSPGSFIPAWMSVEAPDDTLARLHAKQDRIFEAVRRWLSLRGFSGRFSHPNHFAALLLEGAPADTQPTWDAPGSRARKCGNPFRSFLRLFPELDVPLVHTKAFHRQWRYDQWGRVRSQDPVFFYPRLIDRRRPFTPHEIIEATCLLGPVDASDDHISHAVSKITQPA